MRRISLYARDGTVRAFALVDDADFDWLSQWRWGLGHNGYAQRSECLPRELKLQRRKWMVSMHRQILGLEYGDFRQGEHKNRNPLDNRRSNLRIAERGGLDNMQNQGVKANNTSGYRGVIWHKQARKWRAEAKINGRTNYLGLHETPEQADAVVRAFRAEHMPFSEDAQEGSLFPGDGEQ